MDELIVANIASLVGNFFLVLGYFFLTKGDRFTFFRLSAIGSLVMVMAFWLFSDLGFALLNVIWFAISVSGLVLSKKPKKKENRKTKKRCGLILFLVGSSVLTSLVVGSSLLSYFLVISMLVSYFLVSIGGISTTDYVLMNLFNVVVSIFVFLGQSNVPSVVNGMINIIISINGLIMIYKANKVIRTSID